MSLDRHGYKLLHSSFICSQANNREKLTSLSDVSMSPSFGIYFVSICTLSTISESALILKVTVLESASLCSCHGDNH